MDFHDSVSSLSHLFTAVWAVFATAILLRLTRRHGVGWWAILGYGVGLVLLYTASGVFHGYRYDSRDSDMFRLLQKIDKSAIFVMIAACNLPPMVYLLRGGWLRLSLAVMWGLVAVGIVLIWVYPQFPHAWLVGVYAAMGVSGLIPVPLYSRVIGWRGTGWIGLMCVTYLAGAAIEVAKWPWLVPGWVGPHELLHLSDTLGTLFHFVFVIRYLIVRPPLAEMSTSGSGSRKGWTVPTLQPHVSAAQ